MAWRPHICAYASYSEQDGPSQRRYPNPLTHLAGGLKQSLTLTVTSNSNREQCSVIANTTSHWH